MADAKLALKFQIFRGGDLVREEILNQDVIKVGKLASSHLRLDEETVSRMHAVIEIAGPDDVSLIDLGSTRGTTVNGERITKTRLQSGDEMTFGDARVLVTFMPVAASEVPATVSTSPAAPRNLSARPAAHSVPQPGAFAAAGTAAPAAPIGGATGFGGPPPPAASSGGYAGTTGGGPASFASGGSSAAEIEIADGSRAVEVQTIFRGVVTNARVLSNPEGKSTHGAGTGMFFAGVAVAAIALITFIATAMDVGAEKVAYEAWQTAGNEAKNFAWKSRSPALDVVVFGGFLVGGALAYMGLKRRGKTNPNFIIGSDAGADAPVNPDYVPSPAHPLIAAQARTTSSMSPREWRARCTWTVSRTHSRSSCSNAARASRCRLRATRASSAVRPPSSSRRRIDPGSSMFPS